MSNEEIMRNIKRSVDENEFNKEERKRKEQNKKIRLGIKKIIGGVLIAVISGLILLYLSRKL